MFGIKRKPLPNIRSLLNVDFYQNRKKSLWWQGDVYSQRELETIQNWKNNPELIAAIQYFKIHEIFRFEREKLNIEDSIYEISYEDFISDPTSEINKLLIFLNLSFHEEVEKYLNQKTIFNANKKENYYISPEKDNLILKIATSGIQTN